jgi:hypothetical protein
VRAFRGSKKASDRERERERERESKRGKKCAVGFLYFVIEKVVLRPTTRPLALNQKSDRIKKMSTKISVK